MGQRLLLILLCLAMASAEPAGLTGPTAIAGLGDGHLALVEAGAGQVVRDDGEVLATGVRPWGLARVDRRLIFSDLATGSLRWADDPVPIVQGLRQPTGLFWNPADRTLYGVERNGGLLAVDPFQRSVVWLARGLSGAEAVAVYGGDAFVSLPCQDRVVRVELATGRVHPLLKLDLPTGLVIASQHLYVASGSLGIVYEYRLDGSQRRMVAFTGKPGLQALFAWGESAEHWDVASDPSARFQLVSVNLLNGEMNEIDPRWVGYGLPVQVSTLQLLRQGRLTPAGSLRDQEGLLFASGFTECSLGRGGSLEGAPMLRAVYAPRALLGFVDSIRDRRGETYYSLTEGGLVVTGSEDAPRILARGLDDPAGLAVNARGDVFVAEAGAGRVTVLRSSGQREVLLDGLREPIDLAWGDGLLVLEASGRILRARDRAVLNRGLQRPLALAALPDGDLAVVEAGSARVLRLSREGAVRGVLYQARPGDFDPPRLSWRVMGGIALEPGNRALDVAVPALGRWVRVALP